MTQNRTCYLVSLKYAPGLWKEFTLIGECLRTRGFTVKYLMSKYYANIGQAPLGTEYITSSDRFITIIKDILLFNKFIKNISDIFSKAPPKFILFYNPHPLNPALCRLIKKKYPDTIISLYLHDPYKPDKKDYGLVKSVYIKAVEFIQALTVKFCDYIISPSAYSSMLFKKHYPKFKGKNIIAPLLVPDDKYVINSGRHYFSIVGGAHQATGHDTFARLVNHVGEEGLPYKFAIISSSNIKPFLDIITEKGKRLLTVINKRVISDREINNIIRQSFAVFRLDKEVTQSGVIPVSFMIATPVIARGIPGLKQHVKHEVNGYIIPFRSSPNDLLKAMDFIKYNINLLSLNARRSYETIWSADNFDKYYDWLTKLLKS